jgi:hypothetical protein
MFKIRTQLTLNYSQIASLELLLDGRNLYSALCVQSMGNSAHVAPQLTQRPLGFKINQELAG